MNSRPKSPGAASEERVADAESARDLALRELEKSKLANAEFIARITHDLRTPLNAILGFAQILESDHELNERQRQGVSTILQSGHNLLGLIDDLLEPKGAETRAASDRHGKSAVAPNLEPQLELEDDAIPPQEEIAVLHGLALAGSMREILERAQWIEGLDRRYAPFTQHVTTLARAYESQRVLRFIAHHHRMG